MTCSPPIPFRSLVAVHPAVEGDQVTIDGRLEMIARRCECESAPFYCLSCHQPLPNLYNALLHVIPENVFTGAHVVARQCAVHGLGAL